MTRRRPPRAKPEREAAEPEKVRLQAYLARAGIASRRASEEWIRSGRVRVNGRPAELGMSVIVGQDRVTVDGRNVSLQETEWIALHKPKGYVSTRDDESGRKTVYDLLPEAMHHLFHVGRLDRDSSGLLLFTNDGGTAHHLLHPRYGTTKEYLVDVEGLPERDALRALVTGVPLEDGLARAEAVRVQQEMAAGVYRLAVVMREGRKREIRRMFDELGHPVRRLHRRSFGPVELGKVRPGEWRRLTSAEVASLRDAAAPPRAEPESPPKRGPRRRDRSR